MVAGNFSMMGKASITTIALLVASCTSIGETGESIGDKELTSAISGNTVYGTNSSGSSFIQFFDYDGSLLSGASNSRDADGKWLPEEKGQWSVVDGSLCNSYTAPQVRDAGCDRFYKRPDGSYGYVTPNGGRGSFDRVVSGRSE